MISNRDLSTSRVHVNTSNLVALSAEEVAYRELKNK
ncbi:ketohydroxyglutarate aldolase [Streptococcus oricebi]|uniref:Ketohydroxyglutarate aldolase n=1 Tax=Streptococcus oricebi TaxID=1547447 RepID=A0ABS5B1V7_9STRE|nr:ketohydroxyglutarate aldolase [Streptococcus oricebi]